MTLQPIPPEFPYIWGKLDFLFISVPCPVLLLLAEVDFCQPGSLTLKVWPSPCLPLFRVIQTPPPPPTPSPTPPPQQPIPFFPSCPQPPHEKNKGKNSVILAENIEWFIEDQAFSLSTDLAPPPPPPTIPSVSFLSFSVFLCVAGRA
jgi:hypothetical protein